MKNRTFLLVAGGGLLVMVCCCCLIVILFFSSVLGSSDLSNPDNWIPEPDAYKQQPSNSSSEIPYGGLGNDILKRDVLTSLKGVSSCDSFGASDIFIEVVSDKSEHWTVNCPSQQKYTDIFLLEYEPASDGGIDYTVSRVYP